MVALSVDLKSTVRNGALLVALAAAGHFVAYKIVNIPSQLELLVLVAALLLYPVIRRPVLGIYLVFITLPFVPHVRRLFYLQYARPTVDPLIALSDIMILFVVGGLFFVFREHHIERRRINFMGHLIAAYFCYCVIRTFFVNALPLPQAIMQFHFYGPAVLFYFIGSLFAHRDDIHGTIWTITIITGFAAALYGMKQLLAGYSEAEKIWFSSISFTTLFIKGLARPFSFFQSPASFADYMLLSIIGLFFLASRSNARQKWPFFLLFVPYCYAALITSVRSNWIGVILAFVLWFLVLRIRGIKNRLIMFFVVVAAFLLSQTIDFAMQFHSGFSSIISTLGEGADREYLDLLVTQRTGALANPFQEYSLLSRIALWKHLVALSADPLNAILGRGIGAINADSLYINYLAQLGYPGIIFIVMFVVVTIRRGFNLIDRSSSPEVVLLARTVTLMNIVFAVINLTGTHIHAFPGDVYFWFWNGVLMKLAASEGEVTPSGNQA